MDREPGALLRTLTKNKYVLLVLCVGLALLLLPRRSAAGDGSAFSTSVSAPAASAEGAPLEVSGIPLDVESRRIAALLSAVRGVGEAEVLLSSRGCVVCCEGAERAGVRLEVTNAVAAYTGLGSDRICVLKMKESTEWRQ